jgi:HEAT repeat protein
MENELDDPDFEDEPELSLETISEILADWEVKSRELDWLQLRQVITTLEEHIDLEATAFLLESLHHPEGFVRLAAIDALTTHAKKRLTPEVTRALETALRADEDEFVRSSAAMHLGLLAYLHPLPEVVPLLLAIVKDSQANERVRLGAYRGVIHAAKIDRWPRISVVQLTDKRPLAEQIDWPWLEEVAQRAAE